MAKTDPGSVIRELFKMKNNKKEGFEAFNNMVQNNRESSVPATTVTVEGEDKYTKGELKCEYAKWTPEAPIQGFVLTIGKKEIAAFGVIMRSHAMSEKDIIQAGEYGEPHLSYEAVEANAARIVKAWNEYDQLKEENTLLKEALKEELSNRVTTWDADDPTSGTYAAIKKIQQLLSNH